MALATAESDLPSYPSSADMPPSAVPPPAKFMITAAELRYFKDPQPLIIDGNLVDLAVDYGQMDQENITAKTYEDAVFQNLQRGLGPNQIALGPHLLDEAFGPIRVGMGRFLPDFKETHLSVPDAIVVEVGEGDASGVPTEITPLLIRRFVEARTGMINAKPKLIGFSNFLEAMRRDPNYFSFALATVLKGRAIRAVGQLQFIAPADKNILLSFFSPRKYTPREKRKWRNDMVQNDFKRVSIGRVPIPNISILSSSLA